MTSHVHLYCSMVQICKIGGPKISIKRAIPQNCDRWRSENIDLPKGLSNIVTIEVKKFTRHGDKIYPKLYSGRPLS